jgi:Fe-S cluster biosynthesis and repair protein YggX
MQRAVIVLDAESSLHNEEVGKFKAHPQSPNNWAVWLGVLVTAADGTEYPPNLVKYPSILEYNRGLNTKAGDFLLVGHNVGFDIHYLCNSNNTSAEAWREWLRHPDALIWDTQLAEYRLSGQTMTSPSLDACCQKRGLPTKPGRLKEYWSQGISTEDIPDEEVRPYLEHDLRVTNELFRQQINEAQGEAEAILAVANELRACT